jgi:hypothetical protein
MTAAPRGIPVSRGQRTLVLMTRIAAHRGVRTSDLVHPTSKTAPVAWARHELRWALRQLEPGYSNAQIGRITGDADPTTVLNSINRVEERMKADPNYAAEMRLLLDENLSAEPETGHTELPVAPILAALRVVLGGRLKDREARIAALALLDAVGVPHD